MLKYENISDAKVVCPRLTRWRVEGPCVADEISRDGAVVFVLGKPACAGEVVDAAAVHVVDDDLVEEPASTRSSIVVTDPDPLQRSQ